jgi:hypothetical protein
MPCFGHQPSAFSVQTSEFLVRDFRNLRQLVESRGEGGPKLNAIHASEGGIQKSVRAAEKSFRTPQTLLTCPKGSANVPAKSALSA